MTSPTTDEKVDFRDISEVTSRPIDEATEPTFGNGVDPFEALLADADAGNPVMGKWHWKRKDIFWDIRSLQPAELKRINDKNTVRSLIGKNKSIVHTELESEGYNVDIAIAGTINPNFQDNGSRQRLAQKYQTSANDAVSLLKRTLLIGEIYSLTEAILTITGFTNEEDTVSQLKG